MDRWGTLLESPEDGNPRSFEQAELTPGSLDALFHAGQAGWNLYLIGNEESVARGDQSVESWTRFQDDLLEHLRAHGVPIKRCYACVDHPDGKPPHHRDSVFLLPNTGVLYHAAQFDGISLRDSWVIGDGALELIAGWRAGARLAGVGPGHTWVHGEMQVEPEVSAPDLAAALRDIGTGALARPA